MPLKPFPTGTKQWVSLPADLVADPGGTSSYELELPYATVPPLAASDDDDVRFKPLVKIELVSSLIDTPNCGRFPFRRNTGIRTFSFWLAKIDPVAQVEPSSTPPQIELQFRKVVQGHSKVAMTGVLTPDSWKDNGQLVQLSNLLCTGCEVWGRVIPNPQLPSITDTTAVNLWLGLVFDRQSTKEDIVLGDNFA